MPINKGWHKKHKMPKNPSLKQRVRWHEAHQKHCDCRTMPKNILEAMKKEIKS